MGMNLKDLQSVAQYRAARHEQDYPDGLVVVLIEPQQEKEDNMEYAARLETAKYLAQNYPKITFIVGDVDGVYFMNKEELNHVKVRDVVKESAEYLTEEKWNHFYLVCRVDRVQKNVILFIKEEFFPTVLTVDTGNHTYDYVGDMEE